MFDDFSSMEMGAAQRGLRKSPFADLTTREVDRYSLIAELVRVRYGKPSEKRSFEAEITEEALRSRDGDGGINLSGNRRQ